MMTRMLGSGRLISRTQRRVLVMGADSFIGQRVLAALAASNWAYPVAVLLGSAPVSPDIESIRFDVLGEAEKIRLMADADAVVNCVTGSAAMLVDAASGLFSVLNRLSYPPRVVHLSTMAVYGSATGTVQESAPFKGDIDPCAVAQIAAERMAAASACAVTLRLGCVYGAGSIQWSERVARWLLARRIGDLGAAGGGYCNLVYIKDVVTAILAALLLPRIDGEVFNLGSPLPPTWNEYFLSFATALELAPPPRISPRQLRIETRLWTPTLQAAALASDWLGLPRMQIPPALPESLLRSWAQPIRLDVGKAQDVLGIAWTPHEAGLRETAALMKAAASG